MTDESKENCVEKVCEELEIGRLMPVNKDYKKLQQDMWVGVLLGAGLLVIGGFLSVVYPYAALLSVGGLVVAVFSVISWMAMRR